MNICTRRKKNNSHYASQPYTRRSVFKKSLKLYKWDISVT